MPEPYVRMIERRFPRAGLERALLRAGLRRRHRAQAVLTDQIAAPEPIEDLAGDDWREEALLESFERDDPEDDYNDEFAEPGGDPELDALASAVVVQPQPAADYSRFIAAMKAKRREPERPRAVPIAPAPSGLPAVRANGCSTDRFDARDKGKAAFCGQCDRLVPRANVVGCRDRFCKLK